MHYKIPLRKSSFYHEKETKQKLIDFITKADRLSMGDQCRMFEEAFAKKQGRKHAVFVSSGSMANLVLIQALINLGVFKKGDRIGISSITWATNIMPLMQLGLEPVLLECSVDTLNVSPAHLLAEADSLRGLFITNVLGFCDDLQTISEICREKNIILLEDNCESLGSVAYGKLLGNFGLASTFSFFVGHHLSTVEGGMICTDDEKLYHMLIMVRAHGWDRNLPEHRQSELRNEHDIDDFFSKYTFYDLAFNARPTEIQGLLGNQQLQYWDEIVKKRQDNFRRYSQAANTNPDIHSLRTGHMSIISNFDMPIIFKTPEAFHKYKKKFMDAGVEIRPIIAGYMGFQPFHKKYINLQRLHPNASLLHLQGLYFPNNPELTEAEIEYLLELLK